jgi:hypothetical protein
LLDSTDPPKPGDRPPSSRQPAHSFTIFRRTAPEKILTHACWQRYSVPRTGICRWDHERFLDFTMANVLKCSRATVNTVSSPPIASSFSYGLCLSRLRTLSHTLSIHMSAKHSRSVDWPHGCRYNMNTNGVEGHVADCLLSTHPLDKSLPTLILFRIDGSICCSSIRIAGRSTSAQLLRN